MNFQLNRNSLTSVVGGKAYTIRDDNPNFNKAVAAVKANDEVEFVRLVDVQKTIQDKFDASPASVGKMEIRNGEVLFNGKVIHDSNTRRVLEVARTDLPMDGLLNFLSNLYQNDSNRAVEEGYAFLEKENIPVTEDGCFLAYKTVRDDYYSKTAGSLTLLQGRANESGHIFNGVGEVIECLRREVDDVAGRTCSHGLHVGALEYAGPNGWFHNEGDKCVIVKVNPKDMVSVPSDHNANKLRVCKYEVVGEYVSELNKPLYTSDETYEYDDEYEEEDEEVYEEELTIDDLEYGVNFSFDYDGGRRHASVDHIDGYLVTVILLSPEAHAGQYRSFDMDKMSNLEYV